MESPEQEYHLQSQVLDRSIPATYARPVAFSFGGEHLWDRFTVCVLSINVKFMPIVVILVNDINP